MASLYVLSVGIKSSKFTIHFLPRILECGTSALPYCCLSAAFSAAFVLSSPKIASSSISIVHSHDVVLVFGSSWLTFVIFSRRYFGVPGKVLKPEPTFSKAKFNSPFVTHVLPTSLNFSTMSLGRGPVDITLPSAPPTCSSVEYRSLPYE